MPHVAVRLEFVPALHAQNNEPVRHGEHPKEPVMRMEPRADRPNSVGKRIVVSSPILNALHEVKVIDSFASDEFTKVCADVCSLPYHNVRFSFMQPLVDIGVNCKLAGLMFATSHLRRETTQGSSLFVPFQYRYS